MVGNRHKRIKATLKNIWDGMYELLPHIVHLCVWSKPILTIHGRTNWEPMQRIGLRCSDQNSSVSNLAASYWPTGRFPSCSNVALHTMCCSSSVSIWLLNELLWQDPPKTDKDLFVCIVHANFYMQFICTLYTMYIHRYTYCWIIDTWITLKNGYVLWGKFVAWKHKAMLKKRFMVSFCTREKSNSRGDF